MKIDYDALAKCAEHYRKSYPNSNDRAYEEFLHTECGIQIDKRLVKIVDERKYAWFLLKWAS